jgi:uncharacterized protein YukE
MSQAIYEQIEQQLQGISTRLESIGSQVGSMARSMQSMYQLMTEKFTQINEDIILIVTLFKERRSTLDAQLSSMKEYFDGTIADIWEKSLQKIPAEQLEAVQKMKGLNDAVSDTLYSAQLLSILQTIRTITSRAMMAKSRMGQN